MQEARASHHVSLSYQDHSVNCCTEEKLDRENAGPLRNNQFVPHIAY
jgi:hypothetical protein